MNNFFKSIFFATFISVMLVSKNSSAENKIRAVNIDASKLHDDYNKALDSDDFENMNRKVFVFNKAIDDYFLAPVARGYRYAVPEWGRNRISDFYNNLQEPRNFTNAMLQGDVEGMFRAFWRAVVNTTFGIAGFHDVAAGFGLREKDKYFSQTLAIYGLNAGDYVVMPLFGPSTYRDFTGFVADNLMEPDTYLSSPAASAAVNSGDVVSTREGYLDITDDAEENSFDLYSTYKSGYLQNRKKQIEDTAE